MVLIGGALGFSLAPYLKTYSAGVYKMLKPLANVYASAAGHRQMGLRYDDLVIEEREDVQKAIKRLTPQENYDRAFRMKRAIQQSLMHRHLPKGEQLPASEDVRYLAARVQVVEKEDAEREMYDNMMVEKKK